MEIPDTLVSRDRPDHWDLLASQDSPERRDVMLKLQ